jgi:hypothetical protein
MMECREGWTLAKSLNTGIPTPEWRRSQQWEIAEAKAAEMREAGHVVTVEADAGGNPVIRLNGAA